MELVLLLSLGMLFPIHIPRPSVAEFSRESSRVGLYVDPPRFPYYKSTSWSGLAFVHFDTHLFS